MSYQMSPGIVCENGQVLGRMTDLELFQSFSVDMSAIRLTPEIDGVESPQYQLGEESRRKIAKRGLGLWRTHNKGIGQLEKEKRERENRIKKHRIEVMAEAHELGILLPPDEGDE